MTKVLREKSKEALLSILPILAIILLLHWTLVPLQPNTLAGMFVGVVLLFCGLTLFSIGVETAMMPIGEHVGGALITLKKVPLMLLVLLVFGFIVTIAEPDLTVLANQVASMPNAVMLVGISAGVGLFLMLAVLRVMFCWRISVFLTIGYGLVLLLALGTGDYLAVAVDSAAVTTGPVTVPFLLAIGGGFAATSGRRDAEDNNFGISAICSIGPVIAVLLMGSFFDPGDTRYLAQTGGASATASMPAVFLQAMVHTLGEVLIILLPVLLIFAIFQVIRLRLSRTELYRIGFGMLYLLAGLVLFLTGVNVGFMPAARELGEAIGGLSQNWVALPVAMAVGASVVLAEPAVYVLANRVASITDDAIPRRLMLGVMVLGVAIAMGLSMLRILFGFSIWWLLVPAYAVSLTLSFFTPQLFSGIGFDAGAVVVGAMSAAFVIPFAVGVCSAIPGRNVVTDAFGIAGVLTTVPPILIQALGLAYNKRIKRLKTTSKLLPDRAAGLGDHEMEQKE